MAADDRLEHDGRWSGSTMSDKRPLSRRDVLRAGVALPALVLPLAAGCSSDNSGQIGRAHV